MAQQFATEEEIRKLGLEGITLCAFIAAVAMIVVGWQATRPPQSHPVSVAEICNAETAALRAEVRELDHAQLKRVLVNEAIGAAIGAVANKAMGGKASTGAGVGALVAGLPPALEDPAAQKRAELRKAMADCMHRHGQW